MVFRHHLANHYKMPRFAAEKLMELPDRESVLSFNTFSDFASDSDIPGQLKQREDSWWGRLLIDGFPVHLQYFRGHFGTAPPVGPVTLLLADPINMCDFVESKGKLDNVGEIKNHERTVVVAQRGNCTFGEKALFAEENGAAGIMYLNIEEGNMHPPAPDVRELQLSSMMLNDIEGNYLMSALKHGPITATFVPVACVEEPKNIEVSERAKRASEPCDKSVRGDD